MRKDKDGKLNGYKNDFVNNDHEKYSHEFVRRKWESAEGIDTTNYPMCPPDRSTKSGSRFASRCFVSERCRIDLPPTQSQNQCGDILQRVLDNALVQ